MTHGVRIHSASSLADLHHELDRLGEIIDLRVGELVGEGDEACHRGTLLRRFRFGFGREQFIDADAQSGGELLKQACRWVQAASFQTADRAIGDSGALSQFELGETGVDAETAQVCSKHLLLRGFRRWLTSHAPTSGHLEAGGP